MTNVFSSQKIIAFALLHSELQGQICLLLQVAKMPQVTEPEGILSSGRNLESKFLGTQYLLWVERSP